MQCTDNGKVCEHFPCKQSTGDPNCNHEFNQQGVVGVNVHYKCTKCPAVRKVLHAKTM